jgi:uncharacterized protein (TIGR02996 family)
MAAATERDLLAAIRNDPNDHAAIQVYADWLVDRGDPRGELIVLQARQAELNRDGLERLLRLASEHGFLRIPDDADAGVLRFAGGVHAIDGIAIEYAVEHAGASYVVIERGTRLAIRVDRRDVLATKAYGMIRPEAANVVLSYASAAIVAGTLDQLKLPDHVVGDPHYRVGRFPTEPIPAELHERWPGSAKWHIDLRDLARWRHVAARAGLR